VVIASALLPGATATAAPTPIGLGTATAFAIRAGDTITNVPTSSITGNIGLSPASGSFYTDATFCTQVTGTIYSVDSTATIACEVVDAGLMTTVANDARTAFNHTSSLPGATPLAVDLAGQSLVAGLYSFGAAATNLSGTLTLDAQADPDAVWIFQASSSLITSSASTVAFSNLPPGVTAAEMACNVYWTVGSSATIASTTTFIGTILAFQDITVNNGATVTGRLLAGNQASGAGAVTLISDTITLPTGCATLPAGTGGTPAGPTGPGGPIVPTPVVSPPALTG
jgi:hypothetical protein